MIKPLAYGAQGVLVLSHSAQSSSAPATGSRFAEVPPDALKMNYPKATANRRQELKAIRAQLEIDTRKG